MQKIRGGEIYIERTNPVVLQKVLESKIKCIKAIHTSKHPHDIIVPPAFLFHTSIQQIQDDSCNRCQNHALIYFLWILTRPSNRPARILCKK